MFEDMDSSQIGQENRINSINTDETVFSDPHVHNDGSYGFDIYEYDSAGNKRSGENLGWDGDRGGDDHGQARFPGVNQTSVSDFGDDVEGPPLFKQKLEQQGRNQFGSVDSFQQDLNQF
jgi:hypothetical protein